MDVVSKGRLRVGSLQWQPRPGVFALTVVAKATFVLLPVESRLADDQDPISEDDEYWNDDPSRSLHSPSDLAPFKKRADVLLVGNAFAPHQQPVRSLAVRLCVGELDVSLEVVADRWLMQSGQIHEGSRFVRMPLRWERAAWAPDNPVGMRTDGPPDASGAIPLPNIQPPGRFFVRAGDFVPAVGLGPIAPSWPIRRDRLGRFRDVWTPAWLHDRPLPEDLDPAFFNAAPRELQTEALRDNERLLLENLHPEHPRLVTSLPGVRPRARVERQGRADPVEMRPDTLRIDTDRSVCTLTWRGHVYLGAAAEPGRVVISQTHSTMESNPATLSDTGERRRPALPFVAGASALAQPGAGAADPARAPAGRSGAAGRADPRAPDREDQTITDVKVVTPSPFVTPAKRPSMPTMPFVSRSSEPAPAQVGAPPAVSSTHAPPAPPAAPAVPPPGVPAPPAYLPSARPGPDPAAHQLADPPSFVEPVRPTGSVRPPAPSDPYPPARVPFGHAAVAGVLEASNAAAHEPARPEPSPVAPAVVAVAEARPAPPRREPIKLLWHDPAAGQLVRRHAAWRKLILAADLTPDDEDDALDPPSEEDGDDVERAKRHVHEVLSLGEPTPAVDLERVYAESFEGGALEAPLLLVATELTFPFDEVETLKATAAAVSPLAATDKRLKEAVDAVQELLRAPWLEGSGAIAEGLTERLREAFAQSKRVVGPEYLAQQTERMLLQRRAYQMRTVYGHPHIRSLVRVDDDAGAPSIPVYLPEALAKALPMVQRLRCRLLVEVDTQQDQYEPHPLAARALAVARVLEGLRKPG